MACLSRQFTWGHVEIATNYGVESVWIWIAVHASIRSNLDAGCGIAAAPAAVIAAAAVNTGDCFCWIVHLLISSILIYRIVNKTGTERSFLVGF